jgi:hypothetical protein
LKSVIRNRRSVCLLQIIKFAPHVHPTRHFLNAAILVKLIEPRIRIRLQRAAELMKMAGRMLSLAVR